METTRHVKVHLKRSGYPALQMAHFVLNRCHTPTSDTFLRTRRITANVPPTITVNKGSS
jgi:hypothetical protein